MITAQQDGRESSCAVSHHNAWRVFACLALMLGVQLPARIAKGIVL